MIFKRIQTKLNSSDRFHKMKQFGLFLFLIVAITVTAIFALNRSVFVDSIQYEGQYFTDVSILNTLCEPSLNQHVDSLDVDSIIYSIEQLPFVSHVIIYVEPNGTLVVNLEEREPLALLIDNKINGMIDKEGHYLPYDSRVIDLPLLHGLSKSSSIFKADGTPSKTIILSFLSSLKEHPFANATISELVYNKKKGIIAMSNAHGVKLTFGHDGFNHKFENWKAFHKEVIKYRSYKAFKEIDLRFTNQIITREV